MARRLYRAAWRNGESGETEARWMGHPVLSKSPKGLMRMLSAEGNPQARNLFEMVAYLQKIEGTVLEVRAATAA